MKNTIKDSLRKTYLDLRNSLSLNYQKKISHQICKQITSLEIYRYAKHIGLYHPFHREIDLSPLWLSAPMQGKFCYFPTLLAEKKLAFLPATPKTAFKKNIYSILEPDVALTEAITLEKLDLIFMPLVAFDASGRRLGMGGGYYDKTLAKEKNPLLIGVAYAFQRHFHLERDPWDVNMQLIITEEKIYWAENTLQNFP